MINWKQKLSSRKLWAAAAGFVAGLAVIFGLDADTIETVAGAVISVSSVITYIITEGKVDANRVATAVESVQNAVEKIEK